MASSRRPGDLPGDHEALSARVAALERQVGIPNWRSVRGVFAGTTGGAILLAGTGDWGFVRNGVGNYTVNFTVGFASGAVFPICQIYQGANVADVTAISSTAFTVLTFNLAGGAADVTGLIFIAEGAA